jgi:site-specific DNA recombinase
MTKTNSNNEVVEANSIGPTAAIYLRVSNPESARRGGQAEGFSLPIQREKSMARAKELVVLGTQEFIDPGKTATNINRPGMQALLKHLTEERPTYLIVYKLDRLARNMSDAITIWDTLTLAGTTLVSCSEGIIPSTPAGFLQFCIMGSLNQFTSDNLRGEMQDKMIGKIRSGGTIGKAPIGYLNTIERLEGVGEVRGVKLDAERAPLMLWAFETYAIGDWSLSTLTDALQEKGLTTVPGPKTATKPISRSVLARLLRNPYYTGVMRWKGAIHPGNHPRLVSDELFAAVQDVLDSHLVGEKQRVHNHYLKGSVRCRSCGASLCITRVENRHGSEYFYFFCLGNYRRYTECVESAIPVELVEAYIEDKWRAIRFDPAYAKLVEDMVMDELSRHREGQERDRARALKRRLQLNEQRKKLLNAHYMDAIPLELMKDEQDRITKEMADTERDLAAAEIGLDKVAATLRRAMEFLTNCYQTYVMAPPQMRRQLNQAVFECFLVNHNGSLQAKPTEAFRPLLRTDALEVPGADGQKAPSAALHDSRDWVDGRPRWLVAQEAKQGQSSKGRPTPVFSGLGLNKDYLAEGVGFEPTVRMTYNGFRDRPIRPLSHPSGGNSIGVQSPGCQAVDPYRGSLCSASSRNASGTPSSPESSTAA